MSPNVSYSIACSNCTHLPQSSCSYCVQPLKNQITISLSTPFTIKGYECLRCTCLRDAKVTCAYQTRRCYGLRQCEELLIGFNNYTLPYECPQCDNPVTGVVMHGATSWTSGESSNVVCSCKQTGLVICMTKALVENIPYSLLCFACDKEKYSSFFEERSKFF
jgi:hypothetical protein